MQPTPAQHSKLQTFYSILGKALGLAIIGAEAYGQSQTASASSLLQPQYLATLISETEGVIMAAPATPPAA